MNDGDVAAEVPVAVHDELPRPAQRPHVDGAQTGIIDEAGHSGLGFGGIPGQQNIEGLPGHLSGGMRRRLDLAVSLGLKRENVFVSDAKGVVYLGRTEGMDPNKSRYARDLRRLSAEVTGLRPGTDGRRNPFRRIWEKVRRPSAPTVTA